MNVITELINENVVNRRVFDKYTLFKTVFPNHEYRYREVRDEIEDLIYAYADDNDANIITDFKRNNKNNVYKTYFIDVKDDDSDIYDDELAENDESEPIDEKDDSSAQIDHQVANIVKKIINSIDGQMVFHNISTARRISIPMWFNRTENDLYLIYTDRKILCGTKEFFEKNHIDEFNNVIHRNANGVFQFSIDRAIKLYDDSTVEFYINLDDDKYVDAFVISVN